MPPRFLAVLIMLMFTSAALAGCLRPGDDDLDASSAEPEDDVHANNTAALPDGRGESSGIRETNRTEEGSGGMMHDHDYWRGKEQVTLLNRYVSLGATPVYPDGPGTQAKSVAYVKLGNLPEDPERSALVFEGTETVSMIVSDPHLQRFNAGGEPTLVPHPTPPSIFLQWRTASDSDWTEPVQVNYGESFELAIAPQQADMPHSVSSLWVWRITTDSTQQMSVRFNVMINRGLEILEWPGHPDFYADSHQRIVLQEHVSTQMSGITEGYLYDSGGTWVNPERLISWGTTDLVVIINITAVRNAYNAEATGYFLEVHNATYIGPEVRFGDRYSTIERPDDLVTWVFEVPVDADGMDGPYQPSSRWGFRAMATFTDVRVPDGPGVGLCPGCFPYEIEYDITIIALHDPEKAAGAMHH